MFRYAVLISNVPCLTLFNITGLTSRLDYLKTIGVGIVSISPIYKTASGSKSDYDIVDHKAIDPIFGNDQDFTTLG